MNVTSVIFFAGCVPAGLVYWRLPGRFRTLWLFVLSLGFLLTWSWGLTGILLVVATVNFFLGRWLERAVVRRRVMLWIGVGFNLLVLVGLKYSSFFAPTLVSLLGRMGIATRTGGLQFLVAVGLSFIALQMISYLVDVYHRILAPADRWLDFALFVIYFPKLISGPIERVRRLLPEFKQPKPLEAQAAEKSFWLIVVGLVRKIVLADTLTMLIPADIFSHPQSHSGQDALLYLAVYAFAIYNDFAGYTAIVRGVSGFFGIELSSNFELPYFARNFTEFWTRWHISLSSWLRDYIYYPLSRGLLRKIKDHEHAINLVLPPLATMLASGLWHGLGWNFLVWGGLYGVYLIVERVSLLRGPRRVPDDWPRWRQILSTLGIFALVTLAWVPFHMQLPVAWQYFLRIFSPSAWIGLPLATRGAALSAQLGAKSGFPDLRVFLVLLPALGLDWAQLRHKDETFLSRWPVWGRASFLAVLAILFVLLSFAETGAPFVYQGF
jgi:alginate O-acetyltransferase complex protein AlgI